MELRFSIKSSTHYLGFLRRLMSVFDSLTGVNREISTKCSLALVEAVNNAIFHAHKKDIEIWIDIAIYRRDNIIVLEVFDEGAGFDLPDFVEPELDSTHGRGLYIIEAVADEVRYVRGSKNVLRMTWFL